MSKRVKINFESLNKDKYEVIPPNKIEETNLRIKKAMKEFKNSKPNGLQKTK